MKNQLLPPWRLATDRLRVALLALLCLLKLGDPAWAGTPPGGGDTSRPLAEALNPDGTLKPGLAGTFDPTGFRMATAPDGRPVFRPTHTKGAGDNNWQDGFGLPGTDWPVYAVASTGTEVYIGGMFTIVGTAAANRVAKWNGSTWSALGAGVGGTVRALAVSGTDVYAGGEFTTAGGAAANKIAKWNGIAWSPLGMGVNSDVYALAASGTDVYAGGYFTTAGGTPANKIARWNGSAWSALGSGLNDAVLALGVSGTDVYAGGSFTMAGGAAAQRMAKWSGSAWSPLGNGMDNVVTALAVSGPDVYATGYFTTAGGTSANRVARWNGSAWSALGGGVGTGTDEAPRCLTVSGSTVYVGGDFSVAGGGAAENIAQWNGSGWSALGAGTSYIVGALAMSGSNVFAGGNFTTAGTVTANYMAQWNGSAWNSMGSGLDLAVLAVAVRGTDVYLAGNFTAAGGVAASRVVKYNGTTWSALGSGLSDAVYTMTLSGTDLYVGGNFLTAGGIAVNRVAKWDGSAWSALGAGVNAAVRSLAVNGADVYVGGEFTTAGGAAASRIARYNGGTWSTLGTGVSGGATAVYALAMSGTDLYAGGLFTSAGGTPAICVAKWDGSSWSPLGPGVNNTVRALAFSGTDLYAGGSFTTAGGATAQRIAKWSGTAWSPLGAGALGTVLVLATRGPEVYVGGDFVTAGGSTVNRIARWSGSAWSPLGTGLNGSPYGLAVGPGSTLNVGGSFLTVGDASKVMAYFGRYTLTPVNELPVIAAQSFAIAENSATGTAVGTVLATDADAGQTLTYSITAGNTGGGFAINAGTGALTVANPAGLDFETTPGFVLTVTVSDGTASSSAAITISLLDVNEAPGIAAQSFSVAENSAAGTAVGTVAATDPDAGATLSYTLTAGNTAGAFALDAGTGQLTVANPAVLDFETTPTLVLTVQVSDGGLSSSAAVTVTLTDVNETAPTVSITSPASPATSTSPIPVTVTFSEPVTGVLTGFLLIGNGALSNFSSVSTTTYTFDVTPTAAGVVTVDVVEGAGQDADGNASLAPAQFSIRYTAPVTALVWNGSVSTSWFEAANWTPAVVPTTTLDATIPAGAPRYPLLPTGTAFCQLLTLAPGGSLTQSGGVLDLSQGWTNHGTFSATGGLVYLSSGQNTETISGNSRSSFWNLTVAAAGAVQNANPGGVAVQRLFRLNGFFFTAGQPFTLLSDATGTALVINSGGSVFGRVTVQRYVAPDLNAGRGYRHVSAPVSGSTVGDLAFPGFTPVVNAAYNTSATPGTVMPFPTVYGYEQARLASSTNNLPVFDKGWVSPAALPEALVPGRGYTVNMPAAATLSFAGGLGNGDLPHALVRDATGPDAGWHLLGNPYPAPLDYGLVDSVDRPGLDAAMYVYESTSQYGGQYRSYLPPAGANPGIGNPLLALGQGFFVRVSAGQTSGRLTFRNTQRVTIYQNPLYHRTTADLRPTVQLALQGATGPADAVHLYADGAATTGFDTQLDAVKLPNPSGLNLATLATSGEALAIDGRPAFAPTTRIAFSVGVPAVGRYTLTVSELANMPAGTTPYLHDALLGTRTLLSPGTAYAFTMASFTAPGRFWLTLSPAGPLATATALEAQVLAYPNPARTHLVVLRPAGPVESALLLNSLGQTVRHLALPTAETTVDLTGLAAGVYSLRLTLNNQPLTKRVVIN